SRGSRTDLGAPGGENPPGDSTWNEPARAGGRRRGGGIFGRGGEWMSGKGWRAGHPIPRIEGPATFSSKSTPRCPPLLRPAPPAGPCPAAHGRAPAAAATGRSERGGDYASAPGGARAQVQGGIRYRLRRRAARLRGGENGGGKVCHGSGGIVPQLAE